MEGSEIALISEITSVMNEAVEKAKANAKVLADMYVQVKYDDQLFSVFDDSENVLAQVNLDNLEEWCEANEGEDYSDALIALLRTVLSDEAIHQSLRSLEMTTPFSVVLVDAAMEPIIDLEIFDEEIVCLHEDMWIKMDKELDEFFEQLMADAR